MIKKYNLKLIVFLICCLYSTILSAQINTPSGAVVPFGANPKYAYGIMPTNLPTGGTYGKSQDAANAYNTWKSSYVVACGSGYRVEFDDPTVTVSEGIGYGMLLAAYAGDQNLFNGLWTYYKANADGNGLMNWRIAGCSGATGSNGATDADLDAAYALLVAYNQWPNATSPFNYKTEATAQIARIKSTEVNSSSNYQAINGDGWGYSNTCRNPSYQSPAYYKAFNTFSADANWTNAVTSGYNLINANVNGTTGLVSDWSDNNGVANTCNGSPNGQVTLGYGYDACRNPWRMATDVIWNNEARAKTICTNLASYLNGVGAANCAAPLYQNGSLYSGNAHNAVFVSTFAVGVMGSANQALMNQMYTQTVSTQDPIQNVSLSGYFGNTLRCISLFMQTGNFWPIGTTSNPNLTVLAGTTAVPNNSTYNFNNVLSTSSATTTFTLQNLGFNTLTFSGSPVISISGTNSAAFTITQPTATSLSNNATTPFTIKFTPGGLGLKTATITIASNDPLQNPYTIILNGTGTATATSPIIGVAQTATAIAPNGTFNMGTSSTGSNNALRFAIINSGNNALTITSITAAGTGFSVINTVPTTVNYGTSDTAYVWIQATSTTAGTLTGSFTINSNDPTNPAYKVNLTATVVACATAITTNNVYQDYDANYGNSVLSYTNAAWTEKFANPLVNAVNPSYNVAKYVRPATGTYNGVRYSLCNATASVNLTAAMYDVAVMVYSPVAGVPVLMNLKTAADVANTTTYPATSSVTVTTTKTNQWEILYFNHNGAIGKTGLNFIELFIDPQAANGALTYYVDNIQLAAAPCITDLPVSQVLQDFDSHRNVSLAYTVPQYTEEVANPSATGLNTSALVGKFVKSTAVAHYSDGVRYLGCGNSITVPTTKPFISMLVYSPLAGANIQINVNTGSATAPTVVLSDSAKVVYAGQWSRIYFDLTSVVSNSALTSFDIFIDPTDEGINGTYYIDDIQFDVNPCNNFAASNIMDDFDTNRFLSLVNATGTYNDVTANPSATGINTSATVAKYVRPATGTYANFILQPCSKVFDLSVGRSIYTMQAYAAQANVPVVMTLKTGTVAATATTMIQASDTIRTANTWVTLTFDFSDSTGSKNANFMYIYMDPAATFVGTAAQRTYYVDNIQYGAPAPVMLVKQGTAPYKNGSTYKFASGVLVGSTGTPVTFTILNLGLQSLNLNSIKVSNPEFVIDTTQTVKPVGANSSTIFTLTFTPTTSGIRTGTLTILNNDPLKNPYKIYLSDTAKAPTISVLNGTVALATNNTPAISIGAAPTGTAATPAYTFTIKNTGTAPLTVTSITPTTGFTVTALTPVSPVAAGTSATFTVTGTPAANGVNTGSITILTNDPTTPSFKINISVTGTVPTLSVLNGTTPVATNNTPAISVGTSLINTAATPFTFTISNTGAAPLNVSSITPSTGFTVTALTPVSPVAAGTSATFTVTGTPAAVGANAGTITIVTNDPTTPSFKINISVTGTAPSLSVLNNTTPVATNNSPAISVGSSLINTAATPFTFTISNTGSAPLTVTSISPTTGFTVTALAPVSPVPVGSTATFTVTGTPAATGANTGTITIVTNDPTTPSFKLNVSVTGTAPAIQIMNGTTPVASNNTPAISVGSALPGIAASPVTFTINNTGTSPLTISSVTGSTGFVVSTITPAGAIAVGGSATFTVTGTPATTGANTGTVTIASNDPTTPSFKLNVSVTGNTVPALQVLNSTTAVSTNNTPAISVGSSNTGTAATAYTSFSIKNTGTATLTLTSVTGSTGFVVSAITTPGSVAAGVTATFTVTGTPAITGTNTGTITIVTNDPTTPSFVLNVSVTGTAPALQVLNGTTSIATNNTPAISVGSSVVGTAATAFTFTIKNAGTSPLTVTSLTGVAGFAVGTLTPASPIVAGASSTFTVTGTPAATGTNTGTITIGTNDPTTPSFKLNVSVNGTAAPTPTIQVLNNTVQVAANNTPAISVGSSVTGTAATSFTFTIKNTGAAALTISSVTGSTGFVTGTLTPASPIVIGASSTFTVTGTPAVTGTNTGTVTIVSNDPTTPSFVINVSVTGTAPALQVLNSTTTVATNNSPAISVGSAVTGTAATAYTSFSIKNAGTSALTVTSVTGSTGFVVTAITTPTSVVAGASATFTVTGTPASLGTNSGTITITTNDPTTPSFKLNVSVTGTAAPVPALQVLNNGTAVTTNNTPAISVGSSVVGTAAASYTSFSIKNTGNAALNVTSVTGSAGFVAGTLSPASPVVAGATATFTVTGTPASLGTNTGTITISTNDPTTPSFVVNVSITGTAAPAPAIQVLNNGTAVATNNTPAISIGTSTTGTAATAYTSFSIKNTGTAALTLTSVSGSTGFAVSSIVSLGSIASGSTATFTVTGTPAVTGTNSGTITIATNDPTTPSFVINVSVTGTAAPAPGISISQSTTTYTSGGAAYAFPTTIQGNTSTGVVFTITNTGSAALSLGSLTVTGPFQITGTLPASSVPAGGTTSFTVVFSPLSTGTFTGTVSIPSNVTGSPFTLNLSGIGSLATGTVGMLSANAIVINPNPSSGDALILFNGDYSTISIIVYSTIGEKVLTNELASAGNNFTQPLSLSGLPAGVYLVEVNTDQGKTVQRIIKQ